VAFRSFPRDGALLLFDRDTGANVLVEARRSGEANFFGE
jgi:hypothetical protein